MTGVAWTAATRTVGNSVTAREFRAERPTGQGGAIQDLLGAPRRASSARLLRRSVRRGQAPADPPPHASCAEACAAATRRQTSPRGARGGSPAPPTVDE